MRAVYAPDTNFFLQCRDAAELDWSAVTKADSILLVVIKEVQRELDDHKNGPNARRSRRAKAVNSLARQIILESKEELLLRSTAPTVSIALAPALDPKRDKPSSLDLTSADERIAEEAKACSDAHFNGELILLSDDIRPLQAAKELGLSICPIPEAWLLPPEPNENDRQIRELKERVALLEGPVPNIRVSLGDGDSGTINGSFLFYPPLSAEFIDHAVATLQRWLPMKGRQTGMTWGELDGSLGAALAPSQSSLREYEENYGKWIARTRSYLERVATFHSVMVKPIETIIVLSNVGASAADRLVVDISALGGVRLADPDEDELAIPPFPKPPAAPVSALMSGAHFGPNLGGLLDPMAGMRFPTPHGVRDRHEFYWEYDKPMRLSTHCRAVCEDFRHGLKDEQIKLLVRWADPAGIAIAGALKVLISARNLTSPMETTIPVRFEAQLGDTEAMVTALIEEELDVQL